jgi:hypothetical protein
MFHSDNNCCNADLSALNNDDQQPPCIVATESVPLEDRIATATLQNYRDILAEISQLPDAVLREGHAIKMAKNLGINKSTVIKEMRSLAADVVVDEFANDSSTERPMKALFPELVDLVNRDGKVVYVIKNGNSLEIVDTWEDSGGMVYCAPDKKHLQFHLADAENVVSHYGDTNDNQLYEDLLAFCKRFSYLEENVWPIIVLSIFLSYLQDHEDIRYVPVIYFYAVAERGKSRTAKSMLALSYRGIHLLDIRSANIFRFAQNLGATLFFDVTHLTKSAEKGDGTDILLGRFEKGTLIARVTAADKGAFADQTYYNVYGSTIVATNEPADPIFESRCLSITMPNMPGRYENLLPEWGLPLKERLTAFRARMMNTPLPAVEPIDGISGRLWDISDPLFRLATLVAPQVYESMKQVIQEMAGHKMEDKKETVEGQLVAVIDSLADFDGNLPVEIPVERIRTKLNTDKHERFHISPQKLGKRIQSLSLKTKAINGLARLVITARELDVLKEQYGLSAAPADTRQLATTPVVGSESTADNIDSHPVNMLIKDVFTGVVGSGSESEKATARNSTDAYHQLIEQSLAPASISTQVPKVNRWQEMKDKCLAKNVAAKAK